MGTPNIPHTMNQSAKSPKSSYPAKSKTSPAGSGPTGDKYKQLSSINPNSKRHSAPRLSDRGKGSK